jgi:hypothetical protein
MLTLDTTLYFSSISYDMYHDHIWDSIYAQSGVGGKFYIDISKRINPCRFVSRNGEWSMPWKHEIIPGYEMPNYDQTFNKSFTEVSDNRAIEIKKRIGQGEKFAVMFSGGIDSTVVMAALIKNLSVDELSNVVVCASIETMIENPVFWSKFIQDKFKIIDSHKNKYDDLINQGFTPITADEGDCIHGTIFGLILYNNYDYYIDELSPIAKTNLQNIKYKISDADTHFSQYADILIRHLGIPSNPEFGKLFYEKIVHNINTASVPVHSLHDFFWWTIFNIKYLNCAVRGSIYLNDTMDAQTVMNRIINWYSGTEYQLWSMVNNNNGQKIEKTASTYKKAAKDYIWELDRNDWYRNFKVKIESLWNIATTQSVVDGYHPNSRVGLTKDWKILSIDDPAVQNYYRHHLQNYKIDWT